MKVKAITRYHDTIMKRDVEPNEEFEVETKERLNELLGNNEHNLVCVEVILEEVDPATTPSPEDITKEKPKSAKRK